MRSSNSHFPAFRPEREARLVRFAGIDIPQARAAETLEDAREWKRNPDVNAALALYERPMMLTKHPVLQNPVDRAYFYSLLLHESLDPAVASYKDVNRGNVHPTLPRGVVDSVDSIPFDAKNVGDHVARFLPGKFLDDLDSKHDPESMGKKFADRVVSARESWQKSQEISVESSIDATVHYYEHCRKQLDDVLRKNGVFIPNEQTIDPGLTHHVGDTVVKHLRRAEYFQLLVIVWEKGIGAIQEKEPLTAESLRAELLSDPDDNLKRAGRMYAERSFEELGPNDTLERFGVTLGPKIKMKYFEQRQSEKPIEPADVWISQPMHALAFLDQSLPNTEGNRSFLQGLRAYAEGSSETYPKGVNEQDIKTLLALVVESCKEYEVVASRSRVQRQKFLAGRGLNLDSTLEKGGMDVWKFMIDVRKHPIASGTMWLAAFVAVNSMRDMVGRGAPCILRWLFLTSLGAAGYGLYQQHKTGKAWWDDLKKSSNDFMESDRQKSPEEQTFANYWTDRLQLRDGLVDNVTNKRNHAEAVFAALQEMPVKEVFTWYEQARVSKLRDGTLPALPLSFGGRNRRMFGEMQSKDRGSLVYGVLEKFFENRGQYVLDPRLESMYTGGGTSVIEKSQLGFSYLRDKYESRINYEVVTTSFFVKLQAQFGEDVLDIEGIDLFEKGVLDDPRLVRLKDVKPEAYVAVQKFVREIQPHVEEVDTANWSMMDVLFQEADPEILRAMGREATKPADVLERMKSGMPKIGVLDRLKGLLP